MAREAVTVIGLAEVQRDLKKFGRQIEDGRPIWREFASWWKMQVDTAWNQVKASGGTFRGMRWTGMKAQYTRKDGTVVPAWGGVPKVRGRGKVKGRMRPSRTRVKQTSVMMADTGDMRRRLTQPTALTAKLLRYEHGVDYGEVQDARRPIISKGWRPEDGRKLIAIAEKHVEKLIREFDRGR